jgi:hypothetical protein
MSGWTLAKYALALVGLALVIGGDSFGVRWLGYPGLAVIALAFLLRFPQRRLAARKDGASPEGPAA